MRGISWKLWNLGSGRTAQDLTPIPPVSPASGGAAELSDRADSE